MILATRYSGDRELRDAFSMIDTRPPSRLTLSPAGMVVTRDTAAGIPAVGAAIRAVASLVGMLPIAVWEGQKAAKTLRGDSWQQQLLDLPYMGMSDFDWRYDVAVSLEAAGNALLLKRQERGRPVELVPVDMDYAAIRRDPRTGSKIFQLNTPAGVGTFTPADILHIRGHTIRAGDVCGVSLLTQHADPIGAQLARERFEGKYFSNNAQIGLAVEFPQGVGKEQADQWRDALDADHAGTDRAFRTMVVGGGAQIKSFPISLQDAQFVEAERLSVEEAGRIMDVASVLLNHPAESADLAVADLQRFLHFQLAPRLARICRALKADLDLFGPGTPLYPGFQMDEMLFADALTRAQVMHQQIQDGTLLVDEARAEYGRPPLPGGVGQVPQIVPVGGSPVGVPAPASEPE